MRAMLCSFKLIIPSRCGDSGAMYIGTAMCSSSQNLLPFSLRSSVFCKRNHRKENEGRCNAKRGMNVEINVYQTQKKAVAVNLQQKLVFMEVHLFPSQMHSIDGRR